MAVPDITVGPRELVEDDTNKTGEESTNEARPRTLLTVDIEDKNLLLLVDEWKKNWTTYWNKEQKVVKEAEDYWLGIQFNPTETLGNKRPLVDNLIFESLETFLPEATKKNPEAVVNMDNTVRGDVLGKNIKNLLQAVADKKNLRLKLKRQTRYWSLHKLGAIKVGWTPEIRSIFIDVVRTPKLIMDPDSTIDDGGIYTGEYLGEMKEATVEKLAEMFPSHKETIKLKGGDELGTKVKYIEWWTNELLFFTMGDIILEKYRNPHWNYDEEQMVTDEFGQQQQGEPIIGRNHFDTPQIPYVFLSVFNLGKHPLDDTSLIIQNLANQDRVNQTVRQIVRNVKKMNNGSVFASESFTKEEAGEAQQALDEGDGVWVPTGDINSAFKPYQGTPLPADVFNHLQDMRSELRNIFGVKGSSAQGIASEQTVRGKIITSQKDASRIGGGISEYIEQSADRIYNWCIQIMYVYFEPQDFIKLLGQKSGTETAQLFTEYDSEIGISVKEGSMLPKDELTEANQSIDLATAGFLSPIDLYKALDFPDPMETAKNLFMWQNMPQMLFPDVMPQQPPMGAETGIPPDQQQSTDPVPLPPIDQMMQ